MIEPDAQLTPISAIGEFGLIEKLAAAQASLTLPVNLKKGIGDDAAVIDQGNGKCWVVTNDLLAEAVHFDRMYVPMQHLGYKAAISNFSDVYAMNAKPLYLLVSLAIPAQYAVEQIEQVYAGIYHACKEHGAYVVGGDTTASRAGLCISITAIGEAATNDIVYRSGAKEKEILCVSGDLGAAYAGLQILEREKRVFLENQGMNPDLGAYDYVVGRQLKPAARKDVIEAFAAHNKRPTSMIDISDGLASEVNHLAQQSGCGFAVYQNKLPIDYQTQAVADEMQIATSTYALYGGEDYELLFTLRQLDFDALKDTRLFKPIGYATDRSEGVRLVLQDNSTIELKASGFNHFGTT